VDGRLEHRSWGEKKEKKKYKQELAICFVGRKRNVRHWIGSFENVKNSGMRESFDPTILPLGI
jgi:hypothetical protein